MKSYLAIVKLTLKNAIRSHIFQLLFVLLMLCVFFLPLAINDDSTAAGFIRVSLKYSLVAVGTILSLSSIWIGCLIMTQDIDGYQLHMVVSKPVSRIKIWLAKYSGVAIMHLVLLFLSSLTIYFIILWKYNKLDFSPEERAKINNEVMVGRRVFTPEKPDYNKLTRELVKEKIKRINQQGRSIDTSPAAQEQMFDDARLEVVSKDSEAKYNTPKGWVFRNIPKDLKKPMFLRYRPYVGKVDSKDQRMTRVWWAIGVPKLKDAKDANVFQQNGGKTFEIFYAPLAEYPEQVMSGQFHEKKLLPEWNVVTPDNEVFISYSNFDENQSTQYFQPADGPVLLVEVSSFLENYLRAVAVVGIQILVLAGLSCATGAFFTMPTAIFSVISYLMFGSFAVFMAGQSYLAGAADYIGHYIGKLLLLFVIPVQAFEVSHLVADGQIVELSLIGSLTLNYLIIRALPIFILGMILYRRRELGLVIKK